MIWGKLSKNFRACGVKNKLRFPRHKVFDPYIQEISHVGRNEYSTTRNYTANNTISMLACQFLPLYWPGWNFASAIVSPSTPFLLLCDHSAWNNPPILLGLPPILFPQPTASRSPPPLICCRVTKIHAIFKG